MNNYHSGVSFFTSVTTPSSCPRYHVVITPRFIYKTHMGCTISGNAWWGRQACALACHPTKHSSPHVETFGGLAAIYVSRQIQGCVQRCTQPKPKGKRTGQSAPSVMSPQNQTIAKCALRNDMVSQQILLILHHAQDTCICIARCKW